MSRDNDDKKAESPLVKARREAAELALARARAESGRSYPALQDPVQSVREAQKAQRTERRRARHLALKDRDARSRDLARKAAQLEVKRGVYVHLDEAVETPTEEWLAKGDVTSFTPKQLPGTIRTIKSVRRVLRTQIEFAYLTSRLSDEQFAAACWFREIYEQAGMEGRWPTVQLGRISTSGGGLGQSPMPMHECEAYCRDHYRRVMLWIDPLYHEFWEAVVIHSISMRAAARLAKCRNNKIFKRLSDICDTVLAYCAYSKVLVKVPEGQISESEMVAHGRIPIDPD